MLMRDATVVQQLCKSCRTCFKFYCTFSFTCDRSYTDGLINRIPRIHSSTMLKSNTHRRRDSTRQSSRIGVGGVYWALDWVFTCLRDCPFGKDSERFLGWGSEIACHATTTHWADVNPPPDTEIHLSCQWFDALSSAVSEILRVLYTESHFFAYSTPVRAKIRECSLCSRSIMLGLQRAKTLG